MDDYIWYRLKQEFDPEKDAILFEYFERWMHNNQFSLLTEEEKLASILDSLGVFQYRHTGTVPIEDD